MKKFRQIPLALAFAVLMGAVCPQIPVCAQAKAQMEEIEWGAGGSTGEDAYPAEEDEFLTEEPEGDPDETEITDPFATDANTAEAAVPETENEVKPENGIPVVIIKIDESDGNNTIDEMNASSDHSVRCTGTMQIVVPEGFRYCDMNVSPESMEPVRIDYIRGRGNSTWNQKKKPYKIKLDKKADVLGLGANKHWVLLANSMDETLIKDRFAGVIGDQLGFEYTPNGVPVDVVMVAVKDGAEVSRKFLGSYLLAEQIRVGQDRLNLHELTQEDTAPEDITGGYIVQYGHQVAEDDPDKFLTDRGQILANEYPTFDPSDEDHTNEQQKEYIRTYIQKAENAMFGEGVEDGDVFADTEGIRYNDYMDMESAAKYWLIQEVSGNRDGYGTGSTYFYKKEDPSGGTGRIYWGPLWDFDVAFGNGAADESIQGFGCTGDKWIAAMLYDDDPEGFRRTAKRVWPQVRDTILSALTDGGLVDRYYEETKRSYESDYDLWKDEMGYFYENRGDYRRNIEILKTWTRSRIAWIDAHMSGTADDGAYTIDNAVSRVTYMVDGRTVRREYYARNGYCSLYDPYDASARGFNPRKEGYLFTGWLDEDGNRAGSSASVTTDRVFTADFVKEEEASAADAIIFRSDREVVSLSKGSFMSHYSILPADALDKSCTWTSSDETVAAVDGTGRVRFLGTGTAVITATLKSGESTSYELCIVDENTLPEDLVLNTDRIELPVGNNEQIVYTVLPDTAAAEDIWFQTDDSEIAAIDPTGIVTGLKAGTTKATVEIKYYDEAGDYAGIEKTFTVVVFGGEDAEPDPGTPEETHPETPPETSKDPGKPKEPGAPEGQVTPNAPHAHKLVKRNAVRPTCAQDGVTAYWVCSECGKLFSDSKGKHEISKKDTIVKALGHDWSEWKVVVKATADEEGLEESVCSRCGDSRQRAVPKLAPESDHDRDSEQGHGGSGGDKPGGDHDGNSDGKYKDTTDTGDRSNPELWILLAAVAIAGIGGVLLAGWYRRKH